MAPKAPFESLNGASQPLGFPFGTTYTLVFSRLLYPDGILAAYNPSDAPRGDSVIVDATLHADGSTMKFLYDGAGTVPVQTAVDGSRFVKLNLAPHQFAIEISLKRRDGTEQIFLFGGVRTAAWSCKPDAQSNGCCVRLYGTTLAGVSGVQQQCANPSTRLQGFVARSLPHATRNHPPNPNTSIRLYCRKW